MDPQDTSFPSSMSRPQDPEPPTTTTSAPVGSTCPSASSSSAAVPALDAETAEDEALATAEAAALTLEEREQRWGFSLSELHAATKVVRTLFTNPSLFVGDPYLGDSRLYTMITRDRKSKKEHREVYKKIMNEEKSRRRRYQRLQDVEAVRKTTMKREREEALNALLLPPTEAPLLLCDQPTEAYQQSGMEENTFSPPAESPSSSSLTPTAVSRGGRRRIENDDDQEPPGKDDEEEENRNRNFAAHFEVIREKEEKGEAAAEGGNEEQKQQLSASVDAEHPFTSDTSAWSESTLTLFRLVGAYENLLRLETALQRTRWWLPATATATATATTSTCCQMPEGDGDTGGEVQKAEEQKDDEEDEGSLNSPTSPLFFEDRRRPNQRQSQQQQQQQQQPLADDGKKQRKGGRAGEPVFPSSPGATLAALDPETQRAIIASQLTAQVYRYLPHEYDTQMPPPLFLGCPPVAAAEGTRRCYVVWWKLRMARQLLELVPSPAAVSQTETEERTAMALLRGERDLVVCRRPLPLTLTVSRLELLDSDNVDVAVAARRWMAKLHGDINGSKEDGKEEEAEEDALGRVLRLLERWCESAGLAPTRSETSPESLLSELEAVLLQGHEGLVASTAIDAATAASVTLPASEAAMSTLDLFILRRLYGVRAVRRFGASPLVVEIAPPTSDAEEPDVFSVFDHLQVYATETAPEESLRVSKWIGCYTCKVRYQQLHPYYYSMCHLCGEFNYNKRLMTADLRGKNVLLTGCRIKIGYAMALSLLRCGARLLGTTRFAHEALARFQAEPDYPLWKDRLHLFSLDLRDMWVTTQFCFFVRQYFGKLYAIINNAAQTIARTPEYTATLRALEQEPPPALEAALAEDRHSSEWNDFFCRHTTVRVGISMALEAGAGGGVAGSPKGQFYHLTDRPHDTTTPSTGEVAVETPEQIAAIHAAPFTGLPTPQPPPAAATTTTSTSHAAQATTTTGQTAPPGTSVSGGVVRFDRYDTLAEESDTRETNSWVMKLAEVSGGEAAEVMAINALSPFILNSKLKPCLLNRDGDEDPHEPRFIINVSAMEGQFYRYKQTTHPHTNMAKAALNMMSRTSGEDYAASGIYMNSVDTGWITDESPKTKKERRADQLMLCPLDEVDAAARCLDLIYIKSRAYGKFFKDFKEIPW